VSTCEALVWPMVVLGKVREVEGVKVICAAPAVPVPVSVMVWGELLVLSLIVTVALRAAADFGVKAKVSLQLAAAASEAPQPLVIEKSEVSLRTMLVIVREAFPVLVRVAVDAVPVLPTTTDAKLIVVGEIESCALVPLDEPPPLQPARRERAKNEATADVIRSMLESCLLVIIRMPDYRRIPKRRG